MKILSVIPARGGSKGLPCKNIKMLNGMPLIGYTIEASKKSKYINRTIVSTDDVEISDISKNFGAEVPYLRPDELAKDNSRVIDVLLHLLKWLKEKENYHPDIIVLMQPTSPLRNAKHTDGAIERFLDSDADSIISVCETNHSPYWTNTIENNRLVPLIEAPIKNAGRQELPKTYRYNGAIYILTPEKLRKNNGFSNNVEPFIMNTEDSVDIDSQFDFDIAEMILKKRKGEYINE